MLQADSTGSIALVGLPGAGKSTIGRRLAKLLGRDFHDTDRLLERRAGCSIQQFFEREGEERFRDLESEVLEAALQRPSADVIATGGGIVKRASNRALLHRHALAVYLHASPRELAVRLRHDARRPLLQGVDRLEKLHQLYEERHGHYREIAQITVRSVGRPLAMVLQEIAESLDLSTSAPSRLAVAAPVAPSR